jgi:hypothetical protein
MEQGNEEEQQPPARPARNLQQNVNIVGRDDRRPFRLPGLANIFHIPITSTTVIPTITRSPVPSARSSFLIATLPAYLRLTLQSLIRFSADFPEWANATPGGQIEAARGARSVGERAQLFLCG